MSAGEWWRRLQFLVRRDRMAAELEEEMRLHLALREEALRKAGAGAEAEHTARRQFGNRASIEESSRDAWGFGRSQDFMQDVRYATRRLRQRPGFAMSTITVLALGIGATTAMFSALDAAMLRPLPFHRPDQLMVLRNVRVPNQRVSTDPARAPTLVDFLEIPETFSHVAAYASGGLNYSNAENPKRVNAGVVTANFFATLRIPPYSGRTFLPEDGVPNGPMVAVVSYTFWQREFGGGAVLNTAISLNAKPYTIIGVMPQGFSFPDESELWIPMSVPLTTNTFEPFRMGPTHLSVIARVTPGVTLFAASQHVTLRWDQAVAAQERVPGRTTNVEIYAQEVHQQGALIPLSEHLLGNRRDALLILFGATTLMLLIVAANITNLLLSQATTRRRELAVREVLGASRARIIRQLLTESAMLAASGALLGILLAFVTLGALRSIMPAELAGVAAARIDVRVLGFAVLVAVTTGAGVGTWPALRMSRAAPVESIKSGGGPGATAGRSNQSRRGLVVAELALTVVLVVGAALLLRSFQKLMQGERGMSSEQVATLKVSFPRSLLDAAARAQRVNAMLTRLAGMPGITSAGAVNDLPLADDGIGIAVSTDGSKPGLGGKHPAAHWMLVSDDYFSAMGIVIRSGRGFRPDDNAGGVHAAIVSTSLAKKGWPGTDPVGHPILIAGDSIPAIVVGVVDDVRDIALDRDPVGQVYAPLRNSTPPTITLMARGSISMPALFQGLREAVKSVDRSQAVYDLHTMDEVIARDAAPRRTSAMLVSVFALLALVLASLGTYSVVAHGMAQRAREFGIRAALGATGQDLMRLISREMLGVVALGLGLGLAGAWAFAKVLSSMVYGVGVHDLRTFATAPLLLLLTTAIAILLPARRALRVNPVEVIRTD